PRGPPPCGSSLAPDQGAPGRGSPAAPAPCHIRLPSPTVSSRSHPRRSGEELLSVARCSSLWRMDTSLFNSHQTFEPHGFPVHRRRHPRDSPKALPAPEKVSGRVLVAVQQEAAVRTDVSTHTQSIDRSQVWPAGDYRPLVRTHSACAIQGNDVP